MQRPVEDVREMEGLKVIRLTRSDARMEKVLSTEKGMQGMEEVWGRRDHHQFHLQGF